MFCLFSYPSTYTYKKVKANKDGEKPKVRDAIKAIQQDISGKRKKFIESSDSEPMGKDLTPRKKNPRSKAPTESDDNLPARPSRPKHVVKPALTNEGDNLEELPRKDGAKKNKGKGKEVRASDNNKGKATNNGADQSGHVPKPKTSVLSHLTISCHMSLLSLNETTLYYFFLSDRTSNNYNWKEEFSNGIDRWAEAIPDNADSLAPNSAASASKPSNPHARVQVPALTNASTRSSNTSALSKSIKISENVNSNVKVKTPTEPHDTSIQVLELGIQDDDEMMGPERDAALKSPPKGKVRLSSAVTNLFFYPSTSVHCLLIGYHQRITIQVRSNPCS